MGWVASEGVEVNVEWGSSRLLRSKRSWLLLDNRTGFLERPGVQDRLLLTAGWPGATAADDSGPAVSWGRSWGHNWGSRGSRFFNREVGRQLGQGRDSKTFSGWLESLSGRGTVFDFPEHALIIVVAVLALDLSSWVPSLNLVGAITTLVTIGVATIGVLGVKVLQDRDGGGGLLAKVGVQAESGVEGEEVGGPSSLLWGSKGH